MRQARAARVGAVVIAVALGLGVPLAAGCGDDGTTTVDSSQSDGGSPREPEDLGEGCGEAATTDPGDLSATRIVARCGAGAPERRPLPSTTRLRVAVPSHPSEELAPILLAERLGEFAAERLDVELVELDAVAAMAALEAGDVDVVAGPVGAAYLDAVHGGSGARWALGSAVSTTADDFDTAQAGLWLRSGVVDVRDWSALAGQTVAVEGGLGAGAAYPITQALEQHDTTLNHVVVADLPGDEAAARLGRGELAAAWLDGTSWLEAADADGMELIATLPPAEPLGGSVVSGRLLEGHRATGLAYARAVIRTINTHLAGDYRSDGEVMDALAEALGVSADELSATPPLVFDWEIRDGTVSRIEDALIDIGGVAYDVPQPPRRLVDRSLATDAIAAPG